MQQSVGMVIASGLSITLAITVIAGITTATAYITGEDGMVRKYTAAIVKQAEKYKPPAYPTCIAPAYSGLTQRPAGSLLEGGTREPWGHRSGRATDVWESLSSEQQNEIWDKACPSAGGKTKWAGSILVCDGGSLHDDAPDKTKLPPRPCDGEADTDCRSHQDWHYVNPGTSDLTKICAGKYHGVTGSCWFNR